MAAPGPLTTWHGWDIHGGTSAEPTAADPFTHLAPDTPGRGAHYQLIAVAARGFRPPRFLSTAPVAGDGTNDGADGGGDGGGDSPADDEPGTGGLRQTWSLVYRQVAETAPDAGAPYGIYLLGVNPPADATDEDLDVFNDFYTNVHLPEVAERRHAIRAVRYELVREVKPPYQGAPRFLAVYEVDELAASNRRHTGPPYAKGPEVWQRHKTPWRLWYRQLSPAQSA